ncbi:class I SAM-dependent methyltransferase [Methylocaldum sp.]|uniref:class I SAM-dependent methyltransferase n=1 Tax=Methylocaldum sp. TaxID=1969727 RepID=UPI002D637251|nr:class I SAM-dependent methyltransferase [Methylocaldum sp.]HYE35089.1 class I SAM-dependent methyltransferase [Methylocaldum sp.]
MQRVPEPELMDEEDQARAYAEADFSEPHDRFVSLFQTAFPDDVLAGPVLDLGCGSADVTVRFARAFPGCRIDGVDGAEAMLEFGRKIVRSARLEQRVRLIKAYLPDATLPLMSYDAVISNSLLHHLADPMALWTAVKRWGKPGAPVFIMDLLRPADDERLEDLVLRYAADAPEVLRRDFSNSLRAAYWPDEIRAQLEAAGLTDFAVNTVSDRHLVVSGRLSSSETV